MSLNKIFNTAIAVIIIGLVGWWGLNQYSGKITAENNLAAKIKYTDAAIYLTKRQAKEFYSATIDSLSHELNIKPKQITHWIKAEIKYRDTGSVVIKERPRDTILVYPDSITGIIKKPCYELHLLLYKGVFYEDMKYSDKMTAIIYRKRPKKILFIKYGKWQHRAAFLSECRNDTIKVINNVVINR